MIEEQGRQRTLWGAWSDWEVFEICMNSMVHIVAVLPRYFASTRLQIIASSLAPTPADNMLEPQTKSIRCKKPEYHPTHVICR